MVFEFAPKLKETYSLVCKLRTIFRNKKLTKETARTKLHEWYKEVSASRIVEMISAMKTLKTKEDEMPNYFVNRATNAAESLNSKMKGFRSELRGGYVTDLFICSVVAGYLASSHASHPRTLLEAFQYGLHGMLTKNQNPINNKQKRATH